MRMLKAGSILFSLLELSIVSCKQQKKGFSDRGGTAAMVHILDSIAKQNYDRNNPFSPGAQLDYFDGKLKNEGTDKYLVAIDEYFKGDALLKIGREKDAVDLFGQIPITPLGDKSGLNKKIEEGAALANLRYGERANCINNHMSESCLFPIRGIGVQQDETGSRRAIEIYSDLVAKNHGDLESRWLLNIAYMVLGEYPQKVPVKFLIPRLDVDSSGQAIKPFL